MTVLLGPGKRRLFLCALRPAIREKCECSWPMTIGTRVTSVETTRGCVNVHLTTTPAHDGTTQFRRNFVEEQHDFSLVLGGPIFQLFRRTHLEGITWSSCDAELSSSQYSHGYPCFCSRLSPRLPVVHATSRFCATLNTRQIPHCTSGPDRCRIACSFADKPRCSPLGGKANCVAARSASL